MSVKSETIDIVRFCGNCMYANRRLEPHEIQHLKGKTNFKQRYFTYLTLLRRYPNPLRKVKVHCRRENIDVSLLDEACAFWRP